MSTIKLKCIYEKASKKNDGYCILIDRLWPRGLKKEETRADRWLKELAPSAELRTWFNKGETHNNAVALQEYLGKSK